MDNFKQNLEYLLKAKTKCIWIKTYEEQKAINDIKTILLAQFPQMKLCTWSSFEGKQVHPLTKIEKKTDAVPMPPDVIIEDIINQQKEGQTVKNSKTGVNEVINKKEAIYILKDFHLLNDSKIIIRAIRDAKERPNSEMLSYNPIVIISPIVSLPVEHEKLFTIIDYELPSKEQIQSLIDVFSKTMIASKKYEAPTQAEKNKCVDLAQGLTLDEIKNYCARSLAKYNELNSEMFYQARLDLIKKTGILEYKECKTSMSDMGGNHVFKEWVNEVKDTFSPEAIEFGVQKSKGYLALGIPGTSKTAAAEMIASELGLPMLKFDISKIMHSHVGQSEQNMAQAVSIVKTCAPCILFIDEIEKTLGGTGSSDKVDGGTLLRVVGQLLELLGSEESKDIFTIMTSNDVSKLPPELTRSGRLDTLWYFGLPTQEERLEIFKIHYGKHSIPINDDVLNYASVATENFTGAEIRECVKVSIRKAFVRYKQDNIKAILVNDLDLAIPEIIPVYNSSKEKILALEAYAKDRARSANSETSVSVEDDNSILDMDDFIL